MVSEHGRHKACLVHINLLGMFIDLNQIYMTTRFRVTKRRVDGTYGDIGADENTAVYNAFLWTCWSELEIEFNNEMVRVAVDDVFVYSYFYFFRWTAPSSTTNCRHIWKCCSIRPKRLETPFSSRHCFTRTKQEHSIRWIGLIQQ